MKDSEGEFTKASLALQDFPKNFTVCGDFMTDGRIERARIFSLGWWNGKTFATFWYVEVDQLPNVLNFNVNLAARWAPGHHSFSTQMTYAWFPFSWLHVCVSKEWETGKIALVVNGQVLKEAVYKNAVFEEGLYMSDLKPWPSTLQIELGHTWSNQLVYEHNGMISNLNIFSSVLPTDRMVAITDGQECGTPGDYVNWEETNWQLHSKARLIMVERMENLFPCKKESKVTMYSAPFKTAASCMNHCQKIGDGRGPSIGTQKEWRWVFEQYREITPLKWQSPYIWLAIQDSAEEGVWKKGG